MPVDAVSVTASCAVPVIVGSTVFSGGIDWTIGVGVETVTAEPVAPCAVCWKRIVR